MTFVIASNAMIHLLRVIYLKFLVKDVYIFHLWNIPEAHHVKKGKSFKFWVFHVLLKQDALVCRVPRGHGWCICLPLVSSSELLLSRQRSPTFLSSIGFLLDLFTLIPTYPLQSIYKCFHVFLNFCTFPFLLKSDLSHCLKGAGWPGVSKLHWYHPPLCTARFHAGPFSGSAYLCVHTHSFLHA